MDKIRVDIATNENLQSMDKREIEDRVTAIIGMATLGRVGKEFIITGYHRTGESSEVIEKSIRDATSKFRDAIVDIRVVILKEEEE